MMHSFARTAALACALFAAAAVSSAAVARAANTLAPSNVITSASTYDRQTITVAGTVKNVTTGQTPKGQSYTRYNLCDAQCITVVQFGTANVQQGQQQTVSGHFRANAARMHLSNVLIIR